MADEAIAVLCDNGECTTAEHTRRVASEIDSLATRFGIDRQRALTAAWLHDVSRIHSAAGFIGLAARYGIDVLPEERAEPSILHQKVSAAIARERFGVTDDEVLRAIACHTTLRAGASDLALALYVADKLSWDPAHSAPFTDSVRAGLDISLTRGALAHLSWMQQRASTLSVVHPSLRAAYEWLAGSAW